MTPAQGQGVAVYLVDPWTESAHDYLPNLGTVAPVAQVVGDDPTVKTAANLIGHIHQALANDGRITPDEYPQFVRDLLSHPDLQATLGKSVGKWIGLIKGWTTTRQLSYD